MAGYSGDGSYYRLIRNIYGEYTTTSEFSSILKEYDKEIRPDTIIDQIPINIQRGARYKYDDGAINSAKTNAYHWTQRVHNEVSAYLLYTRTTRFATQFTYAKPFGHSLRCVAK